MHTFYTNDGEISLIYSGESLDAIKELYPNLSIIEGSFDANLYYISEGQAVLKPEKPSNVSVFNYKSKMWEDSQELIDQKSRRALDSIRKMRNDLLLDADFAINKAEDNGKPSKALREYRQALRDITSQPGYPSNIIWPTKPE